jgi:glycosyltransferase involved in cell wall biosynthesis
MKVLHVTTARTRRGGENQLFYLAEGLRSRGIDTSVVIPDDSSYPTPMSGTVRIRFRGETDLAAMRRLAALLREQAPDVVHAHTGHAHTWAAVALTLDRSDTPLVVSRRVLFSPARNPVSRWKLRQADRFICVSSAVAGVMRKSGVDADRISVVHSGVPDPGPVCDRDLVRRELGIPPGRVVAVNLAAFTANKNQATLVCALSLVPEGERPVCILAGEGKTRMKTERLARDLDLGGQVLFPGFVEDTSSLLGAADMFVLSSVSEGLSTAAIEAMACGLPVVSTRCGGIEDLVVDGETGLLAGNDAEELAAAISAVASNPGKREAMGRAGRERSALFRVDRMVERTLEVYASLVRGP